MINIVQIILQLFIIILSINIIIMLRRAHDHACVVYNHFENLFDKNHYY